MAKILVVDDEPGMRRVTCRTLEGAGHEVAAYADGRGAVEHIKREAPDLLITDIFMPEMEGLETIRKARDLRSEMPIIAISGGSADGRNYLDVAERLGAVAALKKPFRGADLLALVARLLAARDG